MMKYKIFFSIVLLFLVSLITYSNSLQNGFVFDDVQQVLGNPWITDLSNIPIIFTSSVWEFSESYTMSFTYYRPVMHTIFALEYAAFGLSTTGFHLINILFHTLNAVIVFIILLKVLKEYTPDHKKHAPLLISLATSLVFIVHPMQSEVVNWIAALPELTYTGFFLLALLFYIKGSSFDRMVSILFFILSLLSKEPAITFVIFIYFYNLFVLSQNKKGILLHKTIRWIKKDALFIIAAIIFLMVRAFFLSGSPIDESVTDEVPLILQGIMTLIAMPEIIVHYIGSLLYLTQPSFIHSYEFTTYKTILIASLSITIPILFLLYKHITKKTIPLSKPYIIGILLFLCPLLPALNFYTLGTFTLSDRYIYLSMAGFFLCFFLFMHTYTKRNVFIILTCLILLLSILITHQRNYDWKNTITLFEKDIPSHTESLFAYYYLAYFYALEGNDSSLIYSNKYNDLVSPKQRISKITTPIINYTSAYRQLLKGETSSAIREYNNILPEFVSGSQKLEKHIHLLHRDLAFAHYINGDHEQTRYHFQHMLEDQPESTLSHRALAQYHCHRNDQQNAHYHFAKALEYGDLHERIYFLQANCSSEHDLLDTFKKTNAFMY